MYAFDKLFRQFLNHPFFTHYKQQILFHKYGDSLRFGLVGNVKHPFETGIHFAFPMSRFRAYDNPIDTREVYLSDFVKDRFKGDVVMFGLDISFQIF